MTAHNDVLERVEARGMSPYFHKDWLLQIREVLRPQLPRSYAVFVESEALVVAPASGAQVAAVAPDISVTRAPGPADKLPTATETTQAAVEIEESFELLTSYSLVIRRAPEQLLVGACELLSPTNKGLFGQVFRDQYLRKRDHYLGAGISLMEIDALVGGQRIVPEALVRLRDYQRHAWTVDHASGRRRWRGWGWNAGSALPVVPWLLEHGVTAVVDLPRAFEQALRFNPWDNLVGLPG